MVELTERLSLTEDQVADVHDVIAATNVLIVIAERIQSNSRADWKEFKAQNPDLFTGAKTFLSSYYTKERLDSALARKQFLIPDRIALA